MNLHLKEETKLAKIFLTYISLSLHTPSLTVMNHFNSVADAHFSPPDAPLCLWDILPAARHSICQFSGWHFLVLTRCHNRRLFR